MKLNNTKIQEKIEWLEWHYANFLNHYEFKFDNKRNKYIVTIFDYCRFVKYNFSIFIECWGILKFLQLYNKNKDNYEKIKKLTIQSANEFRLFYTRKGVDRAKHLKEWLIDSLEYYRIDFVQRRMKLSQYIDNLDEKTENEISKYFVNQLNNLIEFIADDNRSVEEYIDNEFKIKEGEA